MRVIKDDGALEKIALTDATRLSLSGRAKRNCSPEAQKRPTFAEFRTQWLFPWCRGIPRCLLKFRGVA